MSPDVSAYRALGIAPGAEPAAVEAAYRKLIKRYHPDREGGDSARAAEINWAYDHIRRAQRLPSVRRTSFPVVQRKRESPRTAGRVLGLALAAVALSIAVKSDAVRPWFDTVVAGLGTTFARPATYRPDPRAARFAADLSEEPLDADAIDRSVLSAMRLVAEADPARLANQSRRCHAELRRAPELSRLDQCIAFDETVVALIDANVAEHRSEFSPPAVTGRQLGAARLFSNDYLAIETRLDRIRTQVSYALAPPEPRQPQPLVR